MKFVHLFSLFVLSMNFSGKPLPVKPEAAVLLPKPPQKVTLIETDKIIPWHAERKLVWDDFLCEPRKEGDAVASTSTSLGLSYQVRNNQLTYHITCDFSKEKSWGSLKTNYILAHEQGHFDITEIHARKLYEALSLYEFNPLTFKKDIADIYNGVVKEKEDMQQQYDGESDHSRRKGLQHEWLDRINQLLAETDVYANYP